MIFFGFLSLLINLSFSVNDGDSGSSDSSSGSGSVTLSSSINYFIGQGDELTKCNTAKNEIASNKENCDKYSEEYSLNCKGEVILYCESNEDKFSEIPEATSLIYLIVGSNSPTISLANIPEQKILMIVPLVSNVMVDGQLGERQQVSLSGCTCKANMVRMLYLTVKILESDLTLNYLAINNCEISEGNFKIITNTFNADISFLRQPKYDNIKASMLSIYLGDSYEIYNLSFTFTKDHWILAGKEESNENHNFQIPYSAADVLGVATGGFNATFIVNDPSTAILKSVRIESRSNRGDFILYSAGSWEQPLKGPLNVSLIDNDDVIFHYSDGFQREWFSFDVTVSEPIVVEPEKPHDYYYFVGKDTELEECIQAKADMEADRKKCNQYSSKYSLDCYYLFYFECQENDEAFKDVKSGLYTFGLIIGTSSPVIDLSKLPPFSNIKISALDSLNQDLSLVAPSKTVTLKGCSISNNVNVEFQSLKINITESNLTINDLQIMSCEIVSTEFYPSAMFLRSDNYFLENYPKEMTSISNHYKIEPYFFDNITLTFTNDKWHVRMIYYSESEYRDLFVPYNAIYESLNIFISENMKIIFNIDDPTTAKLKNVDLTIFDVQNIALVSKGNWSPPLEKPLKVNIYTGSKINYDTTSLDLEWFEFNIDLSGNNNSTNPTIPPEPEKSKTYNIFIGQGQELEECRNAKRDIEENGNCEEYSNNYTLQCEINFELLCLDNDDEFSNINPDSIFIITGTNSPTIDISKFPYVDLIFAFPLGSFMGQNVSSPTKTISLKGCTPEAPNILIYSLKINIVESNLIIKGILSLSTCEIVSQDFYISANSLNSDDYTLDHLPENIPEIVNLIKIFDDSYNSTITFTKDKWVVDGYHIDEDTKSYVKYENSFNYKIAKMLYLENVFDNVTFNINDPNTAKLKSVQINAKSQKLTLFSTGTWSEPLNGPLNVFLENRDAVYDIESLDKEWFRFDIKELNPPSSDISSNEDEGDKDKSPVVTSNEDEGDKDKSPVVTSNEDEGDKDKSPVVTSNEDEGDKDKSPVVTSNEDEGDKDKSPVVTSNEGEGDKDKSPVVTSNEDEGDKDKSPVVTSNEGEGDKDKSPVVTSNEDVHYTSNIEPEPSSDANISFTVPPTVIPPLNITDDTKKENTPAGTINDVAIKDAETIKNDIEQIFNTQESTPNDEKVDHVITINTTGAEEIEFKNLTLDSNQYVKLGDDANVKLTDGQLNLVLDDESKSVNVNVNDTSDVKLSIKNMNDCTVKIGAQGKESSSVTITTKSEVYGHLEFNANKEEVKDIVIDSVNLHDSGSISSNVPITIVNIEAQPQTTGKLTKVVVEKAFTIAQSSVLELDECNLKDATLNLDLKTYRASNYDTPMLKGTLGDPPKEIVLKKPTDNTYSPPDNHKFLLFQGSFVDKCEAWIKKIEYGDTSFNDGVCEDIKKLATLQEDKSVNVFVNPNKGGDKGDTGSKLSGGQIAGIVIGCIAGVAIIVVVVIIVIKKKKNNQDSTAESADGEEVDL